MDIRVSGLSKIYGGDVRALDGIELTVEGGMFGLLGPNGAGKTTLMRILAGILRPTTGSVHIGGVEATSEHGRTQVKRVLGYLPQELGVYPDLSAREFLDYIGILKGMEDRRERKQRVEELLQTVGLSDVAHRKLKGYSGGMKRRVGIAQALLNDPKLLIVDEPTAGLDPEERIRFRNLLAESAVGRTVLLSTHILEDVAQTCRRMAVLAAGTLVFDGTAISLLDAARGHVWLLRTAPGSAPQGDFTIVSTLHLGDAVHYRVVGAPSPALLPEPTEPSLEDGYVWLMRTHRAGSALTLA